MINEINGCKGFRMGCCGCVPKDFACAQRYTNGAFTVDMPRGCVTVMEAGGYAVTGLKHCVRPADLAGAHAMPYLNPNLKNT